MQPHPNVPPLFLVDTVERVGRYDAQYAIIPIGQEQQMSAAPHPSESRLHFSCSPVLKFLLIPDINS